jgi:hypothetical protein
VFQLIVDDTIQYVEIIASVMEFESISQGSRCLSTSYMLDGLDMAARSVHVNTNALLARSRLTTIADLPTRVLAVVDSLLDLR